MNFITELLRNILTAIGVYDEPADRTVVGGRTVAGGRSGGGRTLSGSRQSGVELVVRPTKYMIAYKRSQWNKGAKLLELFDNGQVVSHSDGRRFQKGFNFPLENDRTYRVYVIPVGTWPAIESALLLGKVKDLSSWGMKYETTKVYGERDGFTMVIPEPGPDHMVVLERATIRSEKIGTLTGFWRMTSSGPRALSNAEAIDQVNEHS